MWSEVSNGNSQGLGGKESGFDKISNGGEKFKLAMSLLQFNALYCSSAFKVDDALTVMTQVQPKIPVDGPHESAYGRKALLLQGVEEKTNSEGF